jgi:23S rRNA (uracil1939-C5)-methyltransferase
LNTLLTRLREEAGGRPSKTDREIRLEMAEGDSAAAIEPAVAGLPSTQLTRAVGEFEYSFSPSTFFQGNRLLLEEMVATAVLGRAGSLALELYAGVGLFTLPLASQFSRVIAVESETDATEFARLNIRNANASNIEFHQQRAEAWIAEYADRGRAGKSPIPDFVLLDPPRTGALDSSRHLARLGPKAVTYVSCDPPTLARDLRVLVNSGYLVEQIIAFDLFPQTYHVETIAHLAKAG